MAEELDPAEKELLKNIDAFNRAHAAKGWHIRDKLIELPLSGISLKRSSLQAVHFLYVEMKSATIVDTEFIGVTFEQVDFANGNFRQVVFRNCRFIVCSFAQARLTGCKFIDCSSEEMNARRAMFDTCEFESFEDNSGVYDGSAFSNSRFEGSVFENPAFYAVEFASTAWRKCKLKKAIFSGLKGSELLFEETQLTSTSFEEGGYGAITLRHGSVRAVTIKEFQAASLTITRMTSIEALTFADCTGNGPSISGCPVISELTIARCKYKDLRVEDSQLEYFELKQSEITGDSRIVGCLLAGFSMERTVLARAEVANCAIEIYLNLEGAVLDGVRLTNLRYATNLKMSTKGARYLNGSTRFQGG